MFCVCGNKLRPYRTEADNFYHVTREMVKTYRVKKDGLTSDKSKSEADHHYFLLFQRNPFKRQAFHKLVIGVERVTLI